MSLKGDCKICIRSTKDEILIQEGYRSLVPVAIADYDVLQIGDMTKVQEVFIDKKEGAWEIG
ncbi:MAG: hypothetical protein K6E54_00405 [Bacteroidaceae bacterium]|nr:hypothetical protein [Bacteroidaceae bacterium]